jgi:predicted RNase H-like HicB family nuclease/predicted RNA binding protein YcfA (HicA-like mRNA interferase family)
MPNNALERTVDYRGPHPGCQQVVGWIITTRGSHRQLKHPSKPGRVTVHGKPSDSIAPGTLNSILKQDGLKRRNEDLMRYAVVIEKAQGNYSAYVPDLPGCIATGETIAEVQQLIREAIELHISGMREDRLAIPPPSSQVEYIQVAA